MEGWDLGINQQTVHPSSADQYYNFPKCSHQPGTMQAEVQSLAEQK